MTHEEKLQTVKEQISKRKKPARTKPKPFKDVDELPLKHKALAILTGNGLTTAEASKVLEYKGKSGYQIKSNLNKHNLSNRKLGSLALKAVKETLKMKPVKTDERRVCPGCKNDSEKVKNCITCNGLGYVNKMLYPAHSDRLSAAKMYYDRTDPVVNMNQNLNITAKISPVDMDKYRNKE